MILFSLLKEAPQSGQKRAVSGTEALQKTHVFTAGSHTTGVGANASTGAGSEVLTGVGSGAGTGVGSEVSTGIGSAALAGAGSGVSASFGFGTSAGFGSGVSAGFGSSTAGVACFASPNECPQRGHDSSASLTG